LALALNPKTAQIDASAKNYLEKASNSTKHLGELFRDLLTSSKAEDGRLISYPAVVEIGEILEQAAEAAKFPAQAKGLQLKYSVSADTSSNAGKAVRPLYYAYADANRIREVFQNLVDNAIKYTNEGEVLVRLAGDNTVIQIAASVSRRKTSRTSFKNSIGLIIPAPAVSAVPGWGYSSAGKLPNCITAGSGWRVNSARAVPFS
jgi:signal transduction histidine kinase